MRKRETRNGVRVRRTEVGTMTHNRYASGIHHVLQQQKLALAWGIGLWWGAHGNEPEDRRYHIEQYAGLKESDILPIVQHGGEGIDALDHLSFERLLSIAVRLGLQVYGLETKPLRPFRKRPEIAAAEFRAEAEARAAEARARVTVIDGVELTDEDIPF